MNALRKNLSSEDTKAKLLHLLKVRPVFGPKRNNKAAAAQEGGPEQGLLTKPTSHKDAWELLFTGIAKNNSLQILKINYCTLNAEIISNLAAGLRTNTSLNILDLSFSNLTDKSAQ